jgi:flagellin-like protein
MESVTSNRIYLWSKILGAALLIAMAIVAAGNAQQFSARKKGKVNVVGATIHYPAGRPIPDDPAKVGEDFPAGRWF